MKVLNCTSVSQELQPVPSLLPHAAGAFSCCPAEQTGDTQPQRTVGAAVPQGPGSAAEENKRLKLSRPTFPPEHVFIPNYLRSPLLSP